ncbi:MAG: hypothetical protein HXS47_12390 [Theionarchaea archaeon]|nr:hypothetical protein [Theionarchaea archaeon]
MIEAIREGFSCLKSHSHPVTPCRFFVLQYIPTWIITMGMKLILQTKKADLAISRHALNATDEMMYLSQEITALISTTGIFTPAIDTLNTMIQHQMESLPGKRT